MQQIVLTQIVNEFQDLDLNFVIHPIRKDIIPLKNERAIINAIKNIVLTNHYEKPFNPGYGSNVRKLLFDNFDIITSSALQNEIRQCLSNYEPRMKVKDVIVKPDYDNNAFSVSLYFTTNNITTPITINFLLQRLR